MNKKKKQEKGTLSSVLLSAVAVFVCAFGLISELGPIGIFATVAAVVSFVSNLLAYLLKKQAENGNNPLSFDTKQGGKTSSFGAKEGKSSAAAAGKAASVRRSVDVMYEKTHAGKSAEIPQQKSTLARTVRERRNEVPDAVPVKRSVSRSYAEAYPNSGEDYTRRRMEQLQRFLDAGLIDKAEYETEKRKIREGR